MLRKAERCHRIARAQLHAEGKVLLHDRIVVPEGKRLIIGLAIFQWIDIATDAGIDIRRLHVDKTKSRFAAGAYRRDGHLESVVLLLLGESCLAACGLFLFIDLSRFLLFHHLAGHGLAVDPDGEFRYGALLGHRKSVDRLEINRVGIAEHLVHAGDGIAVLDGHLDMVRTNLWCCKGAVFRRQQAGRQRCRCAAHQQNECGHRCCHEPPEQCFHGLSPEWKTVSNPSGSPSGLTRRLPRATNSEFVPQYRTRGIK